MLVQALALASPQFQLDASLERRAAAGREQLELLKRDAASSPCWEAARSKLETGCRALDSMTADDKAAGRAHERAKFAPVTSEELRHLPDDLCRRYQQLHTPARPVGG